VFDLEEGINQKPGILDSGEPCSIYASFGLRRNRHAKQKLIFVVPKNSIGMGAGTSIDTYQSDLLESIDTAPGTEAVLTFYRDYVLPHRRIRPPLLGRGGDRAREYWR
jgi:hypothetical protein